MNKAVMMEKVDACNCLDEKVEGNIFVHLVLLVADEKEQVAVPYVLQDQVDEVGVLETGVKSYYVLMPQLFLNLDLATKCLPDFSRRKSNLINFFYGNAYTTRFVNSNLNCSVAAFSYLLLFKFKLRELQVCEQPFLLHCVGRPEFSLFDKRRSFSNFVGFFL